MVRISKQSEKRHQSPRKHRKPSPKTGPRQDKLENGYKVQENSLEGDFAAVAFIPKIR